MNKTILTAICLLLITSACNPEKKQADQQDKDAATQTKQLTTEDSAMYMAKSKEMIQMTMKTLGGNLMAALNEKGVAYAANFCKLQADPLVDSLQKSSNVQIRRATLKPRNPQNMADSLEESILMAYMEQLKAGQSELKPKLIQTAEGDVHFYAPIKIPADMCLKCHGTIGQTIQTEDYNTIKELYPEDKAVGYKTGDLRGLWKIGFSPIANL
jgi:hypothetical protein